MHHTLEDLDVLISSRRAKDNRLPCDADYLNSMSQKADFYRLKTVVASSTAEESGLGVFSDADRQERSNLLVEIPKRIHVEKGMLEVFHLDVLRGMKSLLTGEWLCN